MLITDLVPGILTTALVTGMLLKPFTSGRRPVALAVKATGAIHREEIGAGLLVLESAGVGFGPEGQMLKAHALTPDPRP